MDRGARLRRFALLLFGLLVPALGAGTLELAESRPAFVNPDFYSESAGSVGPGAVRYIRGPVRGWSVRHPLARYDDFYETEQGGTKKWFSPTVFRSGDEVFSLCPLPRAVVPGAALAAAALLALVGRMILRRRAESWELVLCAVLLRQFLVLFEFGFQANLIPSAADDPGYFATVRDLLDGHCAGPWKFTIGTGCFYFPFVLASGARNFYDIAIGFDYFNALVLGPAVLALGFALLRKLAVSKGGAFAATLLWAAWPFFIFRSEDWGRKIFSTFVGSPTSLSGIFDWWRYYSAAIGAGFNAMSDTPGMLALFGCLYLALTLEPRRRGIFGVGALFGFACLVRINYIFFAPLLGFLIFRRMKLDFRHFLSAALAGAAGFLLLFGWQLWFNFYQFGSPFTFGYSLHYLDFAPVKRPAAGFTLGTLLEWTNLRLLLGGNRIAVTLGALGLLFTRDRFRRAVLGYWGIVLILFFLGYSHTFCDGYRFIMPGVFALIGSFCGLELWEFRRRTRRDFRRLGWFLGTAAALVAFGTPAVLGVLLALLFCRSLFDAGTDLRRKWIATSENPG